MLDLLNGLLLLLWKFHIGVYLRNMSSRGLKYGEMVLSRELDGNMMIHMFDNKESN